MNWRNHLLAVLIAILLPAAASAATSLAPAPASDCALYAAGLALTPEVTDLDPMAGGITPTLPQDFLHGKSVQDVAGFALPSARLADASLSACSLGRGHAIADGGHWATRIAYSADGAFAAFLLDTRLGRHAYILERTSDGGWRGKEHRLLMIVDPPLHISRETMEWLISTGQTDIKSALATLPLILPDLPPDRPGAAPARSAPTPSPPSGRPFP